ncbi:MAG TPA: NUDIX domain-containing protein [Acidimicrobiales bacterium]|nr:NUDIX domain-containing protein [Acidimicrobiales bacterium]
MDPGRLTAPHHPPSGHWRPELPAGRGGPQRIPRPAGARPGPGPDWAGSAAVLPTAVDVALVRAAMGAPPPERPNEALPAELPSASPRPAAVLCAVFDEERDGLAQAHVLLTRRSSRLRTHTGEISFPGGRLEPGEAAVDAALREAEEETGLDPALVEVIGTLSPLATVTSRAGITPFVAALPGRPSLRANADEVDAILTVPLAELWAPGVHREELWPRPDGGVHPVTFFELVGDTVWGATGRMLRELLDRIFGAAARLRPEAP